MIDIDKISVEKITHINYTFCDVENDKAISHDLKTNNINLRKWNLLKEKNPDLKKLISSGRWGRSSHFSDAVLIPEP